LYRRLTVGLDLGDRYSHTYSLGAEGEMLDEGRVATTSTALRARFSGVERARIVLEAGTHSAWVSRLLKELGHEVIVANPRRLRLIYDTDRKNDRVDAQYLARLGRLDPELLAPIEHRSEDAQVDLALLRSRDALVRARTALVNHVRGVVKSLGARLPVCSTHSFASKVREFIPEDLRPALEPVLETLAEMTRRIRAYDKRIEELAAESYTETAALQQVSGVGALTALCFVLTLEAPERFKNGRAAAAYLGLCPRQSDSGESEPQLRIAKAGSSMLGSFLVGSAHYILGPFGPDTDLRRWGLELAARGGKNAKKRAVVAVARKLSTLLYSLWCTGEVYEPLRSSHTQGEDAAAQVA
jgi:transposase